MQGIGEYTDIKVTPTKTSILFKDRFIAEKFMYGTPGGEIPSVGKVELSWIQTPLPPVNLAAKSAPANNDKSDDTTMMDEGDAMAMTSSPGHGAHETDQQENLDYDVADDNDWGPE
jgi:RNA-binding protein 26